MTNGLGAGLFAVTLLAVLGGLALLVVVSTAVTAVQHRRAGRIPGALRYLFVGVCVCVLVTAGFGVLVLADEAPPAAALFASVVLVPIPVVAGYLARKTGRPRLDVVTATMMAWGLSFFLGMVVVLAVMSGVTSALDLAPVDSRRVGLAWIAAASGGLTVVLAMVVLGSRLVAVSSSAAVPRERA